jgi:hypothetical protein
MCYEVCLRLTIMPEMHVIPHQIGDLLHPPIPDPVAVHTAQRQ